MCREIIGNPSNFKINTLHPMNNSNKLARNIALTSIVAATAIGAAMWKKHSAKSTQTTSNDSSVSSASQPASKNFTLNGFQWKVGDTYTFALRSEVEMKGQNPELTSGLPEGKISTTGTYHVNVLSIAPERITLGTQMSNVTMTMAGERQAAIESILSNNACILELRPTGRVEAIRLPENLNAEDRGYLMAVNQVQAVLPEKLTTLQWQTKEMATDAVFPCSYRALSQQRWEKSRLSPAGSGEGACNVLKSTITIDLGSDWISSFNSDEKLAYFINKAPLLEATATYNLTRQPNAKALPEGLLALTQGASTDYLTAEIHSQKETNEDGTTDRVHLAKLKAIYGKKSLEDVLNPLKLVVKPDVSHADTLPAMFALRDWLIVHPEQAGAIAKLVADKSLPEELTSRMIHALELSAENAESQAALASILKNPGNYSEAVLMQATIAAGGVGQIKSTDLRDALAATAAAPNASDDYLINDAALYALGALSSSNPELRESLTKSLQAQVLDTANTAPRDMEVAFNALANGRIANPEIINQANQLIANSPDADVRAAALNYLGRTASGDQNVIMQALNDSSENVKMEAVNVLVEPTTATKAGVASIISLLANPNTTEAVTGHIITSAAPLQAQFPELTKAFQQSLTTQKNPEVLNQLSDALASK